MKNRLTLAIGVSVLSWGLVMAQQPPPGRGGPPPQGRAAAAFDMTGYWVSVVTEDWRWRMLTPPKGDVSSVPVNAEGRKAAMAWDPEADKAGDNQCKAFGAAAIMRRPGRLNITWQDDTTLKIETSAGTQTRLLRFGAPAPAAAEPTWQGVSVAEWRRQLPARGLGAGGGGGGPRGNFAGGHLRVVTSGLKAGYLRSNGVPYSENTVVTEYFYRHNGPGDVQWLTVTTVVEDPRYLAQPFITSSDFRKEPDGSRFKPMPCVIDPPRVATVPS